jgi:sugar lactone lactonase YvrE
MGRYLGRSGSLVVALAMVSPASIRAQVIDFETLPGGSSTTDQQLISTEYQSLGVTFSLLDRVSGLPIGSPRIAKAGLPQTAFEGCYAPDTPYPYLGLGESFLTDGTSLGVDGDIRIEYTTPVSQASGLILDIDCRTNGGPPCEQWTVTAFDTLGTAVDSLVLDGPAGAPNPDCASPNAGPGDSEAFGWEFDLGAPVIKSIILRYTGSATNTGLAFDNFSVSSTPVPLDVTSTASVDSICPGESVELTAYPTGGLPPYTFRWQQRSGGSAWLDLGSDNPQVVTPAVTADYRVIVTDAVSTEATSAQVTLDVASGSILCDASLLVASNLNSRVVRYSFLSHGAEVFVPSGSGGLNGTSKIDCGPDGNLYAVSQSSSQVLRYDGVTGAFIDVFVSAGSGGLSIPVGCDFGPSGDLYVVSNTNNSVIRYDGGSGAFVEVFVPNGSGLNHPTGLHWGPDDHLYVCSRNSDKVLSFDQDGTPLGDFVASGSGGLDSPRGLVFGPDGNLYVSEEINDSVRRYDGSTGAFIDVFVTSGSGGLDRANDVAFGPDGVLYVASFNNDKVLGYDATTGAYLGALPDDPLDAPAWFAVGCQPRATAARRHSPSPRPAVTVERIVPNPFNPRTRITFTLPSAGRATVTIVDVSGSFVATLVDRILPSGRHVVDWNGESSSGRNASSGVYFVHVQSRGGSAAKKIILLQ